eukprot:sb/3473664/
MYECGGSGILFPLKNRTEFVHRSPVTHIFHTIGLRFHERTSELYNSFEVRPIESPYRNMCTASVDKEYFVEFDSIPGYVKIVTEQKMKGGKDVFDITEKITVTRSWNKAKCGFNEDSKRDIDEGMVLFDKSWDYTVPRSDHVAIWRKN